MFKPYEVPKSFEKFKEMENGEGNFLVFLNFDFFQTSFEHPLSVMNLSKQYPSHIKSHFF